MHSCNILTEAYPEFFREGVQIFLHGQKFLGGLGFFFSKTPSKLKKFSRLGGF